MNDNCYYLNGLHEAPWLSTETWWNEITFLTCGQIRSETGAILTWRLKNVYQIDEIVFISKNRITLRGSLYIGYSDDLLENQWCNDFE